MLYELYIHTTKNIVCVSIYIYILYVYLYIHIQIIHPIADIL